MSPNDRIALELGRAILRAVIAEAQVEKLLAEQEQDEPEPESRKDGETWR